MTPEYLREILDYDPETGVFKWKVRSCGIRTEIAGTDRAGYRQIYVKSKMYCAHRLAWLYMTGEWPSGQIDHINRIRNDNRWCNLRNVTPRMNNYNGDPHKNNKLGVRGVTKTAYGKYVARIKYKGKHKNLGHFDTVDEANMAYKEAYMALTGEEYFEARGK